MTGRPTRRWALGLAVLLVPLVVVSLSPAFADSSLLYLGILPAVVALPAGPRVVWATVGCTGIVILFGLLLSATPWAAAIFFALLGVGTSRAYAYGWQGAATYVTTVAAVAAVARPTSSLVPPGVGSAAVIAGIALIGGLWVGIVATGLLYDLPRRPPEPLERTESVTYAVVLAVALGLGALLAVRFAPGSSAWSVLLTVLLVVTPQHGRTRARAMWRAGGTVLGGTAAAIVILSVSSSLALQVIGLLAALASIFTRLRGPYAAFCATLTLALILLTMPADQALRGDAQRVVLTVVVTGLIVVISAVVTRAYDRYTRATGEPT